MNPKYEIIWTYVAENDLINIIEYISVDSPQNALKILKKFNNFLNSGRATFVLSKTGQALPDKRV